MHPPSYGIQSIACGTMARVLAWHRAGPPCRILGGSLQSYGLHALAVLVCEAASSTQQTICDPGVGCTYPAMSSPVRFTLCSHVGHVGIGSHVAHGICILSKTSSPHVCRHKNSYSRKGLCLEHHPRHPLLRVPAGRTPKARGYLVACQDEACMRGSVVYSTDRLPPVVVT